MNRYTRVLQATIEPSGGITPPLLLNPTPEGAFARFFSKGRSAGPDPFRYIRRVEAAYHMVKCSQWALRACDTDAKIGEFHTDGNFSDDLVGTKCDTIAHSHQIPTPFACDRGTRDPLAGH